MAILSAQEIFGKLSFALPNATSADKASLVLVALVISGGNEGFHVEGNSDSAVDLWGLSRKNYGPVPNDFDGQAAIAKGVLSERMGDIGAVYDGPVCFYDMLSYSWWYPVQAKRLVKSGTLKVPSDQSEFKKIQGIIVDHPEIFGDESEEAPLPDTPEKTDSETVETKPPTRWGSIILGVLGVVSAGTSLYLFSRNK